MTTQLIRPFIHTLIYGMPHSGKSTFTRTMPTPNLVFFFDPYGKDSPYLEMGTVKDLGLNEQGTPVKHVLDPEGKLLYQMEYYHEHEPQRPTGYRRFLNRLVKIHEEYGQWATITVDSVTYLEILARLNEKYVVNPNAKDGRQWYAGAKDTMEEVLMVRFGGFPMNVCVVAHEAVEKVELTGEIIRGVNAVGKLSRSLSVGFNELYRMKTDRDMGRILQTDGDHQWPASSGIHAPNPCKPDYASLWANHKGQAVSK